MYPAFGKYFDESLTDYYTYDVEKAKELLAQAGYPDGFDMTITVPSNYQPHMDTAEVLVQQLAAVGVRATIQPSSGRAGSPTCTPDGSSSLPWWVWMLPT